MIGTIAAVLRGEGVASALRRANERIGEAAQHAVLRARGAFGGPAGARILNVAAGSIAPRSGGVATQLMARLRAEQPSRSVALLHPGGLRLTSTSPQARKIVARTFEERVREALAITGARAVHLEGTFGVPIAAVLRLAESGVAVVVSIHDLSLLHAQPHGPDGPGDDDGERRHMARRLFATATGIIFPSQFLLGAHGDLLSLSAHVVEPGVPAPAVAFESGRRGVAFAGSVKPHKGGQILPELVRMLAERDIDLHVFGGGDCDLLLALRRQPNVVIHGYYRVGRLPSLLARNGIGLVVLPSVVPESFSLTLSEAWLAGVPVAAFDHGAIAERIRRDGGGWLTPLESGASGLAGIVERWREGGARVRAPSTVPSPADAAAATIELYRRWGLL